MLEEVLLRGAVRAVGGVVARKDRAAAFRDQAGGANLAEVLAQAKRDHRDPIELELLAQKLGLTFSRWDELGLFDTAVPLYRTGRDRGIETVLYGMVAGTPLALFDYDYEVGAGDDHVERHFTCAQIGAPRGCPTIRLTPTASLHRFEARRAAPACPLEGEVGDRYTLETSDRAFAGRLLDDHMRSWLLDGPDDVEYEAGGHWGVVVSKPLALERWEALAKRAIVWGARISHLVSTRARSV